MPDENPKCTKCGKMMRKTSAVNYRCDPCGRLLRHCLFCGEEITHAILKGNEDKIFLAHEKWGRREDYCNPLHLLKHLLNNYPIQAAEYLLENTKVFAKADLKPYLVSYILS